MQQDCQQPKNTRALDYFIERGFFVVENENGWANYLVKDNMAWIENFYIYPEKRNKQAGTSLLNHIEMEIAEVRGIHYVYTFISKELGNPEMMKKIIEKRGYKLQGETDRVFAYSKEL